MKNTLLYSIITVFLLILTASCRKEKSEIESKPQEQTESVALILNSGNWEANDASITLMDCKTGLVTPGDLFSSANGIKLGDVANDMILYGSKLYIAVSMSSVIFVCDTECNIIKAIQGGTPRHFCAHNGKVFATMFEGHVAEIDTTTFAVRKVSTGPNPEGIACAQGKLYVADSFGYDPSGMYGTTVTVIDEATLTPLKTLTVNNNPQSFHVCGHSLYLISWGNYSDIPARLQKIDTSTDEVTTIEGVTPTAMTIGEPGTAYIMSSTYDENWNQTFNYSVFDTSTDTIRGELIPGSKIPGGSFISYDSPTKLIYIGTSDYVSEGDIYVLDTSGRIISKSGTGGMNPVAISFLKR